MPNLEIWLTSLLREPSVQVNGELVRVYLHEEDDLDHVLSVHGSEIPNPLGDHLRLLWSGKCPERLFEVIDESTVVIRLGETETPMRQRLAD